MPHLVLKMAPGRSDAMKERLADRLTAAITDVLGLQDSSVSILFEEVGRDDWMAQVYGPEIEALADRLIRKPGYGPLAGAPEGTR